MLPIPASVRWSSNAALIGGRGRSSRAATRLEVNQETATALEPKNQILAAAIERRDALARQLGLDELGVEGSREPCVVDLHVREPPPDDGRLEPAANRLDLGQLGHPPSVAMARLATAPECARS